MRYFPIIVLLIIAVAIMPNAVIAQDTKPDPLRYADTIQIYQGTEDGRPAIISRKVALAVPDEDFLYIVVAVGEGHVKLNVVGLPAGLTYSEDGPKYELRQLKDKPRQNAATGRITGKFQGKQDQIFTIIAANEKGTAVQKVTIKPHNYISPTPPMGWLSWEFYHDAVTQEKIKGMIDGMASAGLSGHGWKYIVIDDTWQQALGSRRQGEPLKPNEKFPDVKALSDYAKQKGFSLGIYTTPWIRSYAGYEGSGHNEAVDAKQFADWGIGYIKLDYRPWEVKQLSIWQDVVRQTGKDMVLAFSNHGLWDGGADFLMDITDVWRTGTDIGPTWSSIVMSAYTQYLDKEGWKYLRKGHWPDLDMLMVGSLREGQEMPQNEQQFQMSLWAIIPAPLMLTCDMTKLTPFHLKLLTNDEVIGVNQDSLGLPAKPATSGNFDVLYKPLSDGTVAVGFFNKDDNAKEISVVFKDIGLKGIQPVRDLWEKKDLGDSFGVYKCAVGSHCARLFRIGKSKPNEAVKTDPSLRS